MLPPPHNITTPTTTTTYTVLGPDGFAAGKKGRGEVAKGELWLFWVEGGRRSFSPAVPE